MYASLVALCLAVVIGIYFYNNPLGHGSWFLVRRFINWFPLGMTYSFLYMARYNLNVSKTAMGGLMSNEDFGIIFGVGAAVYGCSFMINGPLVDRIGGKRGIIIAAIGASLANVILGVLTYLAVMHQLKVRLVVIFSVLYALNMYFQSYGAVSIIKVKAYWFHVRERGVFGAIFGTLISFGVYFAFDWGAAIVNMAKANPVGKMGWLQSLIQHCFALKTQPAEGKPVDATWAVFFIPAAILIFWAVMDAWLIKDTPEEANFPPFDAADASSGHMDVDFTMLELWKKVFCSRLMMVVSFIGLAVGVLRNGIMNWYLIFVHDTKQTEAASFFVDHWGLLLCIFGIIGGFAGGLVSDKMFQSRRGPPAAILNGVMLVLVIFIAAFLSDSPLIVGWSAVLISMAVIGVHSLMSGTAAPDFGGRKATATCAGIVDGFVYLGSSLQSVCLGYLTGRSWHWWPLFLIPFTVLGMFLGLRIWKELPAATRKYIATVEHASVPKPKASLESLEP